MSPEAHVMLDLETLSTAYNARILAIGAVMFEPDDKIYGKFYQAVKAPPAENGLVPCTDALGFHISAQTLSWWESQSIEARAVFSDPNAVDIQTALTSFSTWILTAGRVEDIRLWGNGASFDNVILSTAYQLTGLEQPWKFYNDRCYRTVKNLYPDVPLVRTGTYHNALDDAETQAEHLLNMKVTLA